MEERKSCWWIPLVGLLLLGLLGWLMSHAGGRADKTQERTRMEAQDALTSAGFGYATAEADGYNLIVRGTAPDAAARDAACQAARDGVAGKIGLPGVFASVQCRIVLPGESEGSPSQSQPEPSNTVEAAKPVEPLKITGKDKIEANTCQARLNEAAASGTVNFAKKQSDIIAGQNVLDKVAAIAKECSKFAIEVGGHTDTGGAAELNQSLSEARANAVRSYLLAKGVPEAQLTAKGYGETKPLVNDFPNGREDLAARARNRRTEFVITALN
jgi:outer membrane protein OmpA-like peptidoglycan-associated protein